MRHYGPFNAVFVVSVILSLLVCKEDPDAFPACDPTLEKGITNILGSKQIHELQCSCMDL